jgi:hypothetical protein
MAIQHQAAPWLMVALMEPHLGKRLRLRLAESPGPGGNHATKSSFLLSVPAAAMRAACRLASNGAQHIISPDTKRIGGMSPAPNHTIRIAIPPDSP